MEYSSIYYHATSCTTEESTFDSRERQLLFKALKPLPIGNGVKRVEV